MLLENRGRGLGKPHLTKERENLVAYYASVALSCNLYFRTENVILLLEENHSENKEVVQEELHLAWLCLSAF